MSQPRADRTRKIWSAVQIRLHWLVALLLLVQWWSGESMPAVVDALKQQQQLSATQFLSSSVHSYGGIGILILIMIRIRLRLAGLAHFKAEVANEPKLLRLLANITHFCLYTVLVVLALSGILVYYEILPISAKLHHRAGSVLMLLVILHLLAAAYHGWYRKDGVLSRMWPESWPRL